jgi:hypothetical protein
MGPFVTALRVDEPGYFVVITADGEEIPESRRRVPEGRDPRHDKRIVNDLRALMGPTCEVVFRPRDGFR